MKSLKELFRIGYGPSSSHTMAPRFAAERFLHRHSEAAAFEVTLFGSLAATGRGHFTDQAINAVLGAERTSISWMPEKVLEYHPNAMTFKALDGEKKVIAEETFYSVGGGALKEKNSDLDSPEIYPFKNMTEIMAYCKKNGTPLWHLAEDYEGQEIWDFLKEILNQLENTVENGLHKEGVLPGALHLPRKAHGVYLKSLALRKDIRRTGLIAAYAYAAAEENASVGKVVTAPTCGSCGVLPAVMRYCRESRKMKLEEQLHALAAAGIIGNVVKQNGSISGAEVGCQGEVGTACAMSAAAAAAIFGGTLPQIEYAAEIGLEHFLGLTCDPLMGLVQIPCIERNALAANRSIVAAEMALLSDGVHMVSFDAVVQTMLATGHDLPSLYRETSTGGLSIYAAGQQ